MNALAVGSRVPWQISWQDAQDDGGLPMDSLNEDREPEERPEKETILGYDVEMGSLELHGIFLGSF